MSDADPNPAPAAPPAPPVPTAKAAPRALYYLLIDGTHAVDSVEYGQQLEAAFGLGWRNLAGEFIDPAPDDPNRLVDPAHPYLPIHLFEAGRGRGKVAVVCPNGKHGNGLDPFLATYSGETVAEQPDGKVEWADIGFTTFGRATAFEKSALFLRELILDPGIHVIHDDDAGTVTRQFADQRIPLLDLRAGFVRGIRANLLFVSSHGWLGGYMRGDVYREMSSAQPEQVRPTGFCNHSYFLVGLAAKEARAFRGPEWIILAQCSTLNNATWPLWTKLFNLATPGVRGILAYEEVSPGPTGSVRIAREFFAKLKTHSILDAWRLANRSEKWAAIVHKEAIDDRMQDWRQFRPLSDRTTSSEVSNYLGFIRSGPPAGEEIFDRQPPFGFKLEQLLGAGETEVALEVEPSVLDASPGFLRPRTRYRVAVTAPAGRQIHRATIKWIHIRPSHPKQFRVDQIFSVTAMDLEFGLEDTVEIDPATRRKLIITPHAPMERVAILSVVQPANVIQRAGIEVNHSYFYPEVVVEFGDGQESFAFRTTGMQYMGDI